ncbi:hypothetical protein ACFQZ4_28910 [Catellatospora coxensis]
MRAYASGLLWFLGICGIAALAVVLIRRSWPPDRRADTHDVLSVVFSMTGTLYAVVAAFVFIDVWQIGNDARDATYREAQAVQSVAWAAETGPPEVRASIRLLSRAYLREILDQELPGCGPENRSASRAGRCSPTCARRRPGCRSRRTASRRRPPCTP